MHRLPADSLFDVAGLVGVVFGAGALGTAAAGVLAASRMTVSLVDDDQGRLAGAAGELRRRGAACETTEIELNRPGAVGAFISGVLARHGRIDVAVLALHPAPGPGYLDPEGRLADDPLKRFGDALEDGLDEAFYALKSVARPMREAGRGRIVVVATPAARRSDPFAGYGDVAAGAALVNAARQAAHELAPDGVLVNVVVAGQTGASEALTAAQLDRVPLGRIGTPDDLEGVVLFLCAPAAAYVTGAVIAVDGGALVRQNPLPPAPFRD